MFYHDNWLQYTIRVDTPNPMFAKMQQQWLAVIEELGGYQGALPIPNSFPQELENQDFNYAFLSTAVAGIDPPRGRFTSGPSLDGKGEFSVRRAEPQGDIPTLGFARPDGFAQKEQSQTDGQGLIGKVVDAIT